MIQNYRRKKKKPRTTQQHVGAAYARAKKLGTLTFVTAETRDDGSPMLDDSQVYVTRTGTVFHTEWCSIVENKWNDDPMGLLVAAETGVGARQRCQFCVAEAEYDTYLSRDNG